MSRWWTEYKDCAASLNLSDATVVCLGNFDGVHRGHREILLRAKLEAKRRHQKSILFTFNPHPSKVLNPTKTHLELLLEPEERRELLNVYDFDHVVEQNFNRDFSLISAEAFAKDVLKKDLQASCVVVGQNFHFGYRASGNSELLRRLQLFEVPSTHELIDSQGVVSSTRIRAEVKAGHLEAANAMLGYPYFLSGKVIHGQRLGTHLGFPTLNLSFRKECLPPYGVYAGLVQVLQNPQTLYTAAINWGFRPTVDGVGALLEAHVIDQDVELYGKDIRVFLIKKVRDEQKFGSKELLQQQIGRDVEECRQILKNVDSGFLSLFTAAKMHS